MNRVASEEQAIQLPSFGKQWRLGRVQVFGLAVVNDPAAKTNHAPARVMNRKHHPIAETVIPLAAVAVDHEAGMDERIARVVRERRRERLPVARRIANPKACCDGAAKSTFFQILDCPRRRFQVSAIELRRGQQHCTEISRCFLALLFPWTLDARYFQAGVAGKLLDRVGKRFAAVLHQETDRSPMRAASEAVIELLDRAYGERRRLFAVERAAGLVVGARFFERNVAIDDLDNVDAAKKRRNKIIWNHRLERSRWRQRRVRPDRKVRSHGRDTRQGTVEL